MAEWFDVRSDDEIKKKGYEGVRAAARGGTSLSFKKERKVKTFVSKKKGK
jgi:hypothetical protein